jgi:hypothetical protein
MATQGGDSMFCRKLAAAFTVVLSALMMPSIQAQDQDSDPFATGPELIPPHAVNRHMIADRQNDRMAQPISYRNGPDNGVSCQPPMPIDANLAGASGGGVAGPVQQQGYVRLGAPMYPTPRPNIPIWTGATMITNQALAPQEMLYPHTYRAMYPPFYHRVKGGWILTPLGVRSHEKWELQGTMVQVKYRSSYPGILSGAGWHPPATSYWHGSWK